MKKIIYTFIILLSLCITSISYSAGVDLLGNGSSIEKVSINTFSQSGDIVTDIEQTGIWLLTIVKIILQGVLLIYIVYIWVQMVMSMGTNEEELSNGKRQLWYSLIAFIFINIPGGLYNAFSKNTYGNISGNVQYSSWFSSPNSSSSNVFIDIFDFWQTLNGDIIGFIEVAIGAIAILVITLQWLQVIWARWREEVITEAKNKITWSIVGLIFIGFIEAWKSFVFSGNISDGVNLFETAAQLLLFLAWPITIIFLTLAGYYYITAAWDEEKIKKSKNIIINTLIASVILLASYSFLLDIATL